MSPLQSEAGLERWVTPKRHTFDFIISVMKRRVKRYLTVPRNNNENYRKTLANVNAKIPRFLQYDTPIAFAMLSMVPFV